MKMEHKEAIDRARLHGLHPSTLAHELLQHDLVDAALFELKNIHAPYSKLNEGSQQEVINRITEKVQSAVSNAIQIIASRGTITIPCKMKQIQVTEKTLTVTSLVDAKDPARHGLTDSAGHLCLLVLAPDDYDEGLDFIQPDRDQSDLPLHVSDVTGSLFDNKPTGPDEAGYTTDTGTDPLYADAAAFVVESRRATISAIQRKLGIGYNRAAVLMDALETNGVVSPMDHTGAREVLLNPEGQPRIQVPADDAEELINSIAEGKEFGDFTYEDAAQLLVLKSPKKGFNADWLQSRLAIDSDQASSLLIRLLDNEVIKVETEGESALTHTYKVTASLEDVA